MKKFIYSQHDEKADFYNHPQISEIEPEAFAANIQRSIKVCRDPKLLVTIADCKLVKLGEWDDETGVFTTHEPVVLLECDKLIQSLGLIDKHEC